MSDSSQKGWDGSSNQFILVRMLTLVSILLGNIIENNSSDG